MKKRTTPEWVKALAPKEVFVFGSNFAGKHGAGAAKMALKFGARYGRGRGLVGQTYAIPTKDGDLQTLKLECIKNEVNNFIAWAAYHTGNIFLVTEIGCGLAGYTPAHIAPLFAEAVKYPNIFLPASFWDILNE